MEEELNADDTISVEADAMPSRRYIFGKTKVYPLPTLNPEKAPWSSPRGYTTTIREDADKYKATVRLSKVSKVCKSSKVETQPTLKVEKPAGPSLWQRLKSSTFESNLEISHKNINNRVHMLIGYICCIRADVAAIYSDK